MNRQPGEERYEVGSEHTVRAFHRMPGMEGIEGELHHHDYRIQFVMSRSELADGMVVDLDLMQRAVEAVLDEIEDRDLDEVRPAGEPAMTVEVLARWLHTRLETDLTGAGAATLDVRVWETDTAFGGYSAPIPGGEATS